MDARQTNTDVPTCPGCAQRDRRITELEARIAALEQQLASVVRAGKRQAAPFAKAPPKENPKTPGRKPGPDYGTKAFRTIPPHIDEFHDAPLPAQCPFCAAKQILHTHTDQQYQADIPRRPIYRQFNVEVGQCTCCGKRVQGRHPLQTSDALGCCASQIGPEAQAAAVLLNKELGLSQGKISRVFAVMFGIKLTPGGSCQIILRVADRCEGNYQAIVKYVRQADMVVSDETGWRIGGRLAWLHVAVADMAVAYLIARERGIEAIARLIGEDFAGRLVHDGFASYDRFWKADHQTCLGHLLRRCQEILESAVGGAVIFPRKVKALLQESLEIRDRRDAGEILPATAARYGRELTHQMRQLVTPIKTNPANERLAAHLARHIVQLFLFLRVMGLDATNHQAEQAIRPAVVNRKVWGGNRTENGAVAQSILMTIIGTAKKRGREALEFISDVLRALPGRRPLLLPSG